MWWKTAGGGLGAAAFIALSASLAIAQTPPPGLFDDRPPAPISLGTHVSGALEAGDKKSTFNRQYLDEFVIEGQRGDRIVLTLRSQAFAPRISVSSATKFVGVAQPAAATPGEARLEATLPEDGRYIITASTDKVGEAGPYQLVVEWSSAGKPMVAAQVPTAPAAPSAAPTRASSSLPGPALQASGPPPPARNIAAESGRQTATRIAPLTGNAACDAAVDRATGTSERLAAGLAMMSAIPPDPATGLSQSSIIRAVHAIEYAGEISAVRVACAGLEPAQLFSDERMRARIQALRPYGAPACSGMSAFLQVLVATANANLANRFTQDQAPLIVDAADETIRRTADLRGFCPDEQALVEHISSLAMLRVIASRIAREPATPSPAVARPAVPPAAADSPQPSPEASASSEWALWPAAQRSQWGQVTSPPRFGTGLGEYVTPDGRFSFIVPSGFTIRELSQRGLPRWKRAGGAECEIVFSAAVSDAPTTAIGQTRFLPNLLQGYANTARELTGGGVVSSGLEALPSIGPGTPVRAAFGSVRYGDSRTGPLAIVSLSTIAEGGGFGVSCYGKDEDRPILEAAVRQTRVLRREVAPSASGQR